MDEKELLAGLNPEQIEVVQHDKGPCLVSACAGAGKTAAVVRRMAYLATVRGVNPARIFGTTFTRKAAGEMNTRIKKLLGDDTRVQVQTFHSFCRSVLVEEMPDFKRWRLDERDHYRDLLKKAAGYENLDWQKSDIEELVSYVELAKAGAHRPNSDGARELAYARYELDPSEYRNPELTLQVYELAERFRREAFLMTFADWLVEVFELFKGNEGARRRWASLYDYVIIDEAQDNSAVQIGVGEELARDHKNLMLVGDIGQCVAKGTLIETPTGSRPVETLTAGQHVISYRNKSKAAQTIDRIVSSGIKDCVEITTSSGRNIVLSVDHKIWASLPRLTNTDQRIVYLMYRSDLGFRVGITNKDNDNKVNRWGARTSSEAAERMWVLDIVDGKESALHKELSYSLKYGVPTVVFEGAKRGLNQHRIDRIFEEFGRNGMRILEEKNLKFDHPHWMASNNSGAKNGRASRRTVRICSHTHNGTNVSLEWNGSGVDTRPYDGVHKSKRGGKRIRKWFRSYRSAVKYAHDLASRCDGSIRESMDTNECKLILFNSAALMPTMKVAISSSDGICVDEIISVKRGVKSECFDLDVDDAGNFFGNGILSHNSIYKFRGAEPELFSSFPDTWNARVISMFRNYRSGRKVIEAANRVLEGMAADRIREPMVAMRDTDAEIRITEFPSPELEAQHVVDSIRAMHEDGARLNGMVVLYRVNSLSRAVEEELAEQKIPYRVLGSTCFYNRKEIANLLAYLRVAWRKGATMDDVRRSLFAPHRFLGKVFMGHVEQAGREKPESFQRLVERAFELSTRITNSQKVKATMWASLIDNLRRDIADGKEASNPGEMLQKIVDATNYNDWLRRDEGRESPENDRPANVAELIASARKFRNVGEFIDHTKTQIEKAKANSGEVAGDRVTLMSIHRSKGLEYPHVFLISCNYKVLPHFFAEDKEEEKRLFYVAVTRAMDTLNISAIHFESEDPRLAVYPSPFLNSLRSLSASESMPETEDSLPSGDWSSDSLNHIDDDDWMPGDGDLAD